MKIRAWIFATVMLSACTETTRPPDPREQAVRLGAASPTSVTAPAGTLVKEVPTVIAYDANGSPVAGAVVRFTMESGMADGASIEHSVDTTNADGVAHVRFWKVGTKTIKNILSARMATGEPIVFSATVLPGPVSHIVKIAGDNQVVAGSSAVKVDPQLMVTDAYDNAIPGTLVTFGVTAGGGSIPGNAAETDSLGLVTLAGWTAGERGDQILRVAVGSVAETFHATAVPLDPCSQLTLLVPLIAVSSELQPGQCIRNGRYYTAFYFTTPYTGAWILEMRSTAFDSYLEVRHLDGSVIAADDNTAGAGDSRVRVVLPAGTYQIVASSNTPSVGGAFRLLSQASQQVATGCEGLFVPHGTVMLGTLHPLVCNGVQLGNAQLYRMHLEANESAIISVDDLSYSGSKFLIMDENGEPLAAENVTYLYDLYYTLRYVANRSIDILVKVVSDEDWAEYSILFR
jgi:hypothetical protein